MRNGLQTLVLSTFLATSCTHKYLPTLEAMPEIPLPYEEQKELNYDGMTYQQAIEQINNPIAAQQYLDDHLTFGSSNPSEINSFNITHNSQKGVCKDYALAAAALLSDDGYQPIMLVLRPRNIFQNRHAVFLYKTPEGFGTLGNTPVPPIYDTVEHLIQDFNIRYLDSGFTRFYILKNYNKISSDDSWIHSTEPFEF